MAVRQRSRKVMDQSSDSSDGASDSQDAADDNQESENTDSQDGEEPEKPDGNGQSAEAEEISLSDIQEGDIVSITLDEDGNAASITVMSMEMGGQGQPGGDEQGAPGQGGPDGQSQGVDSYTAANEYTEDTTVSNETIESTGTDENAALISSGANVTLDNDTITRTSAGQQGRRQFQLLWRRRSSSGNRWYCLCERWQRDYRCSRRCRAFCIW